MIICCHRINTIKELKNIPHNFGIEVDINVFGKKLCLSHDASTNGVSLNSFLKYYKHKFIIFNIKSEGLEIRVLELIKKFKIKKYFFLDSSFPFIYKLSKTITKNFAIRVSDYENINTALKMTNRVKWIWLDCFKKYSISIKLINKLKINNFKICLVFPDLHGREVQASDKLFYKNLNRNNIRPDMICIKKRNIDSIDLFF